MSDEFERRSMPWLNVVLDWEGVAAAAGAFLAALLLGWIWGPLFWIGFAAMLLALAAGRWSRRSPPDIADGVVAPCDGIVLSIGRDEPPTALRLSSGNFVRVRIASSPVSTNKLYTPIAGGVDLISLAQGEPSAPLALRPDDEGLTRAYVTFESAGEQAESHWQPAVSAHASISMSRPAMSCASAALSGHAALAAGAIFTCRRA